MVGWVSEVLVGWVSEVLVGWVSEGFKSQLTSHKNFDAGVIEKLANEIAETASATGCVGQHTYQMKQEMLA